MSFEMTGNTGNATFFFIVIFLCIFPLVFGNWLPSNNGGGGATKGGDTSELLKMVGIAIVLFLFVMFTNNGGTIGYSEAGGLGIGPAPQRQVQPIMPQEPQYVIPEGYKLVPVEPASRDYGQNGNG